MKLVNSTITLFFLLTTTSVFSQLEKTIDSLQKVEQACLNTGIRMPYCSYAYMQQMDSILNVAYSKRKLSLSPAGQANLKLDEINWIKKKDIYFEEIDKEYAKNIKSGEWGPDMRMISYDEKAEFIKKRVLVLLDKNTRFPENTKSANAKEETVRFNFIHFFPDTSLAELVALRLHKKATDITNPIELSSIQGSFIVMSGETQVKDLTGIGYLIGIDTLGCNKNEVTEIPAEIGKLTKLKYLDLVKAFLLDTIPPEIGLLKELRMIRLGLTQVSSIPKEIGNLINLETLWLGNNKITSIPKEIGNLKKLTDLDISSNQLKQVPDEICNLGELTRLMITHCGLETLPENIGNLKNLKTLNLNNNHLHFLPKSIANLTKLSYLNVFDNPALSESYKEYLPVLLQKKKQK